MDAPENTHFGRIASCFRPMSGLLSWVSGHISSALCYSINVGCAEKLKLFDLPGGVLFFWMFVRAACV